MKTHVNKGMIGSIYHRSKTPYLKVTVSNDTRRGEYLVMDILFRFYIILN